MNYFFKFLLPQLMEFFDKNNDDIFKFIPKIILKNYQKEIEKTIDFNKN